MRLRRRRPRLRSVERLAARAGALEPRLTFVGGWQRLRGAAWPIIQTAAAAGVAWTLAVILLDQSRPVYAPIAAIVALGASFNERGRRAVETIGGVVVGIVVADLLIHAIGTGPLQTTLLVLLAMGAAIAINGSPGFVSEAAVSAIVIAAVAPGDDGLSPDRFLEALIGGGVGLAINALLFPPKPERLVDAPARALFEDLEEALNEIAAGLLEGDAERAARALGLARTVDERVEELDEAIAVGRQTALLAPARRAALHDVERYADVMRQSDFATRNTRVLARDALRFVRTHGAAPEALGNAVRELAQAVRALGEAFQQQEPADRPGELALQAAGRATALLERHSDLSTAEVVGRIRATAVDLVRAAQSLARPDRDFAYAPTEELLAEPRPLNRPPR